MRLTKTLGMAGALILAALVGGTLIGSALAQDDQTDADTDAATYCDTFMETFAVELGATRDEVVAAGKAAANAAVDAAVAAGDLTEERATEIRERIDAVDGSECSFGGSFKLGFGHGVGHGERHGFLGGDVFEAAADALGLSSADLITRLDDAGSLEALAEEQGVAYADVRDAVLAAVQADLDAAVAEGLDQERADAVIERLTALLAEGGQFDGLRRGPSGGALFGGQALVGSTSSRRRGATSSPRARAPDLGGCHRRRTLGRAPAPSPSSRGFLHPRLGPALLQAWAAAIAAVPGSVCRHGN